mgnify:CR=1 FL=1
MAIQPKLEPGQLVVYKNPPSFYKVPPVGLVERTSPARRRGESPIIAVIWCIGDADKPSPELVYESELRLYKK